MGVRETGYGYQAFFKFRGRWVSHHFPGRTPQQYKAAQTWILIARGRLAAGEPIAVTPETPFQHDVAAYLESVTSMPSYTDRRLHMFEWAAEFSGVDRNTIRPLDIKRRLEQMLARGYQPSTVNKRRTALMSFYTALNGKSGYNPVRDVPKYQEDEEPRGTSWHTVYRVLACMGPSKTRTRLRVLLWTGWPHKTIARVKAEHLDLAHAKAYVTPRRKGKGTPGRWLPLLPAAVTALKRFHQDDCYGSFSHSSMYKSFALALGKLNAHRKRLKLPPLTFRPYDLRHTFGTMIAERTTDDRALQELMLHSRPEQSLRYTKRATAKRVESAVEALATSSNRLGVQEGRKSPQRSTRIQAEKDKKAKK